MYYFLAFISLGISLAGGLKLWPPWTPVWKNWTTRLRDTGVISKPVLASLHAGQCSTRVHNLPVHTMLPVYVRAETSSIVKHKFLSIAWVGKFTAGCFLPGGYNREKLPCRKQIYGAFLCHLFHPI